MVQRHLLNVRGFLGRGAIAAHARFRECFRCRSFVGVLFASQRLRFIGRHFLHDGGVLDDVPPAGAVSMHFAHRSNGGRRWRGWLNFKF